MAVQNLSVVLEAGCSFMFADSTETLSCLLISSDTSYHFAKITPFGKETLFLLIVFTGIRPYETSSVF